MKCRTAVLRRAVTLFHAKKRNRRKREGGFDEGSGSVEAELAGTPSFVSVVVVVVVVVAADDVDVVSRERNRFYQRAG